MSRIGRIPAYFATCVYGFIGVIVYGIGIRFPNGIKRNRFAVSYGKIFNALIIFVNF